MKLLIFFAILTLPPPKKVQPQPYSNCDDRNCISPLKGMPQPMTSAWFQWMKAETERHNRERAERDKR